MAACKGKTQDEHIVPASFVRVIELYPEDEFGTIIDLVNATGEAQIRYAEDDALYATLSVSFTKMGEDDIAILKEDDTTTWAVDGNLKYNLLVDIAGDGTEGKFATKDISLAVSIGSTHA